MSPFHDYCGLATIILWSIREIQISANVHVLKIVIQIFTKFINNVI